MAMYLNLSSAQNDIIENPQQDLRVPSPAQSSPSDQQQQQLLSELQQSPQTPLSQPLSLTGKRKAMEAKESSSGKAHGMNTIDPLSLIADESKYALKRQRLDSANSSDFSVPLTAPDESFTSSYVFLHSTVSRPASSSAATQTQSNIPSIYTAYQNAPQEEERILREEFFSQMSPQAFLGQSGSFSNLAGYALPPPYSQPAPSPYALPSFNSPMMQNPTPYNNNYYAPMAAPPPMDLYSRPDLPAYNPTRTPMGYPTAQPPMGGAMQSAMNPEEFIAETKLSKNIKKMTTMLGQIPGLEKIRWQSILQGTRSPDVGEREIQRRVKEAETIGARLFGGDIDKLLGSILNQHLDFLVTYVANLKHGKKKHNKLRMRLSKVLQDTPNSS